MKYIACILLLALAGCSAPTIKTDSGYKPGAYRISQFTIEPSPNLPADKTFIQGGTDEFNEFKNLLSTRLPGKLATYNQKNLANPEVGMTITVDLINLKINKARAVLISDALQTYTTVTLWDIPTHKTIGSIKVIAMSKITSGLLGITMDAFHSDDTIQAEKNNLADEYIENLFNAIYPK